MLIQEVLYFDIEVEIFVKIVEKECGSLGSEKFGWHCRDGPHDCVYSIFSSKLLMHVPS